jgi:hypothetical protein
MKDTLAGELMIIEWAFKAAERGWNLEFTKSEWARARTAPAESSAGLGVPLSATALANGFALVKDKSLGEGCTQFRRPAPGTKRIFWYLTIIVNAKVVSYELRLPRKARTALTPTCFIDDSIIGGIERLRAGLRRDIKRIWGEVR